LETNCFNMDKKIAQLKRAIGDEVLVNDKGRWIGKLKKVDILNCECLIEFKEYGVGQDGNMIPGDAALVPISKVLLKSEEL
jgi:hypothetical protein